MVLLSGTASRRAVLYCSVLVAFLLVLYRLWPSTSVAELYPSSPESPSAAKPPVHDTASGTTHDGSHVIERLVQLADQQHEILNGKRTHGVDDAARAYRQRRGRHPPPGFDKYVQWCEAHGVVMIEDFFDRMHTDLAPFWAVSPRLMRDFPKTWSTAISIRNGSTFRPPKEPTMVDWMGNWEDAIRRLPLADLPDVDLAFNNDDEPKLFVPWETIQTALATADADLSSHPPELIPNPINAFSHLEAFPEETLRVSDLNIWGWSDLSVNDSVWLAGREACPPGSQARNSPPGTTFTTPASPLFPSARDLQAMEDGFVANWTRAKSTCDNPHLRLLHGAWVGMQPVSLEQEDRSKRAVITTLVPLLSGCKMSGITSEILVPPAMQLPASMRDGALGYNYDPDRKVAWNDKQDVAMWRGKASGGVNKEDNWARFHRHRLVVMMNATLVAEHQRAKNRPVPEHIPGGEPSLPYNIPLPSPNDYALGFFEADDIPSAIHAWMSKVTDAGFLHLFCWPPLSWYESWGCYYNGQFFELKEEIPSEDQFKYKYLPDVDGGSYSGRFRALLQSKSLPIKATIFDEWHDSRLVPWRHFVPMDNTFVDLLGLLDYFVGYEPRVVEGLSQDESTLRRAHEGHDEVAKRIASQGSEWSQTTIRTEDQLAWLYRLILEMARLCDDRRLEMGYAGPAFD